jgi:hypothetical protein
VDLVVIVVVAVIAAAADRFIVVVDVDGFDRLRVRVVVMARTGVFGYVVFEADVLGWGVEVVGR